MPGLAKIVEARVNCVRVFRTTNYAMLDEFLKYLARWSPLRFWTYGIVGLLIAMELTSWITLGGPTSACIVDVRDYSDQDECPTLHVLLLKSSTTILQTIGHDWLLAAAAVATAVFTATLWFVTNESVKLTRSEILSRTYLKIDGECGSAINEE